MVNSNCQIVGTQIKFRWFGAAGVEIKSQRSTLLIDPLLTRPSWTKLFFGKVAPDKRAIGQHIKTADHILISHTHFDHFMDAPDIAFNTGATIFGSPNTCELARKLGVSKNQVRLISAGDCLSLDKYSVEVIKGDHVSIPGFAPGPSPANPKVPMGLRDYKMDGNFTFKVEVQKISFLFWQTKATKLAKQSDILFIVPEENQNYYKDLLLVVRPKLIVLIHWDYLFRPLTKPTLPFLHFSKIMLFPAIYNLTNFSKMLKDISSSYQVLVPEIFKVYPA